MLLYTDTVHIQQLIFYIKVLQNRVGFAQMPFILIFTFLNPPPKKNPHFLLHRKKSNRWHYNISELTGNCCSILVESSCLALFKQYFWHRLARAKTFKQIYKFFFSLYRWRTCSVHLHSLNVNCKILMFNEQVFTV